MKHHDSMDRRDFLRYTSRGAALAGLGVVAARAAAAQDQPKVTPADPHAPKTGKLIAEGAPIGLAVIGVGGQGGSHFEDHCQREKDGANQRMRAVCDV
jgi:hypothetical protein